MSFLTIRRVKSIPLLFLLGFCFLSFQFFPFFGNITREVWLLFLLLSVPTYIIFSGDRSSYKLYGRYKIYILLSLLVAAGTSVTANIYYDQELFYGLLSQRAFLASLGGVLLIILYKRGKLTADSIMLGCLALGWLYLIVNYSLYGFVDPYNYSEYAGFAGGHETTRYYFHYQYDFLALLFFYLFLLVINRRDFKYVLVLGLIIAFIAFIGQKRAALLAIFVAVAFHLLRNVRFGKTFFVLQWSVLLGILAATGMYFYDSQLFDTVVGRFSDAVTVVLSGQLTEDDSANTRIYQLDIAKEYISDHLFFGNGRISVAWRNGYQTFINHRFFPADMGTFGGLYVYGVFGVMFLFIQFYFPYAATRQMNRDFSRYELESNNLGLFAQALVMLVVYYLLYGILHATFFFEPYRVLNTTAILMIVVNELTIRKERNMEHSESDAGDYSRA